MVQSCAAINCKRRRNQGVKIKFHRFPKDCAVRNAWIQAMRRDNYNPGERAVICEAHFVEEDYVINVHGNTVLKKGAIPSIFDFPPHLKKNVEKRERKETDSSSSQQGQTVARTDEPEPGAFVCGCHFFEAADNEPDIACENAEELNNDYQETLSKNEETTDPLQADPLELSNLLMEPGALNKNVFENAGLSATELATNINNLRNESPTMLKETIELIQNGNPQIEAVFIDSDSEGDCNDSQVDLETLMNDDLATDDAVDDSATDDASETAEFTDYSSIEAIDETDYKHPEEKNENLLDVQLIKSFQSKSETLSNLRLYYTEKDIERFKNKRVGFGKAPIIKQTPRKNLNENAIMNNSLEGGVSNNTLIANKVATPPLLVQKIALKDASKILASSNILELSMNSEPDSRKKFLVIPNNVLHLFKEMDGCVAINIPGVGAVHVQNPAELNEQKPLEDTVKPKEKKTPKTPVKEYDPLTDPKFRCWKHRRNVKRDLEGFSYYERMGFYRADVARAAACANKTKLLVHQLELSLKRDLARLNIRRRNSEIGSKFKIKRNSTNFKQQANIRENVQDHCYSMNARLKVLDQDPETAESDLLITKKVVILEDEEIPPKRSKNNETAVNETVKCKRGRPRKYPIKKKLGRPKKNIHLDDINNEEPDDVKFNTPCYVALNQTSIAKEYLDVLKEKYNSPEYLKIITTLRDFQSAIDVSKPILVVNKNQWPTINLEESSQTNNIVWPTSGTEEFPPWIGLTADIYNIKFVQSDILCKYLSGEREND